MKIATALMISIIFSTQCLCREQALYDALDRALKNDSSNLFQLHYLFYPTGFVRADTMNKIIIPQCRLTVDNISDSNIDDRPAFIDCGATMCGYKRGKYCFNQTDTDIIFSLSGVDAGSNSESHSRLHSFISDFQPFLKSIDYTSFILFNILTLSQLEKNDALNTISVFLEIDHLHIMPLHQDVIEELKSVLAWAKYYARTYGSEMNTERKDTDRMLVGDSTEISNNNALTSPFIINLILLCALNVAIAIAGVYSIPKFIEWSLSYFKRSTKTKELGEFYWSSIFVLATINIVCTGLAYYWLIYSYSKCKKICDYSISLLLYYALPLNLAIFFIEVILIWVIARNFVENTVVLGYSNRYLMRALHTLAMCQILWFLHRIGISFLVAAYFVALAPAQTLAAISLIYFVIIWTVIYVTMNLHYIKKIKKRSCILICKLIVLFLLYFAVVIILIFLTIMFNKLGKNGLTSSGLGSVIISLLAPTIVFIITLKLKKLFDKYFASDSLASEANINTPLHS